jgi:hypothetical protein
VLPDPTVRFEVGRALRCAPPAPGKRPAFGLFSRGPGAQRSARPTSRRLGQHARNEALICSVNRRLQSLVTSAATALTCCQPVLEPAAFQFWRGPGVRVFIA